MGWLLGASVLFAPCAYGHKPSDSYLSLTVHGTEVAVRWDVALRDLDPELGLDVNDDGVLTWGEVRSRASDITAYVLPQLEVRTGQGACNLVVLPTDERLAPAVAVGRGISLSLAAHSDGTYAALQYVLTCGVITDSLVVDYRLFATNDPTHRGIVRVSRSATDSQPVSTGALAVLGPGDSRHVFPLSEASRLATLRAFIVEGIWHIWLGFDHVLFLLTLLLPSVLLAGLHPGGRRSGIAITTLDVLRIVTGFTVAHSITLTLAVLNWVSLPSRLVESGIALTVLLGALNNIRPVVHERRWVAAFVFGLIHGFGFAGALKALRLPAGDLALSLFGFNLGVEIGQLAIVGAFVPLAYLLRGTNFYRVVVVRGGSCVIAVIAAAWFVERAWDIQLWIPP